MKLLVFGDTHIAENRSVCGMRPTADDGRTMMLKQCDEMMQWVIEMAMDHDVDAFVHTGDVFHIPRPSSAARAVAVNRFIELTEVCPGVVIPGNHDRPMGGGAHALVPMKNLAPGELVIADTTKPVTLRGIEMIVYPVPYPVRSIAQEKTNTREDANGLISVALGQVIAHHAIKAGMTTGQATVLLAHGTFSGSNYNEYQVAPATDVRMPTDQLGGFTHTAFGHIHLRQKVAGRPGYPGSPDRADFGEEGNPCGLEIVTFDGARRTGSLFIQYPGARRFVTIAVEDFLTSIPSDPPEPDRTYYRVKGETDSITKTQIVGAVRALRGTGIMIADQTTVERVVRARVDVKRSFGIADMVNAAYDATPSLTLDRDDVIQKLKVLLPDE